MKIKFYLAGSLLIIAGGLHLLTPILAPLANVSDLQVVFTLAVGVVYIVLGAILVRLNDVYLMNTALVVLFGLIVDIALSPRGAEGIMMATMVVEALALAVLAYLYFQSRAPLGRVR